MSDKSKQITVVVIAAILVVVIAIFGYYIYKLKHNDIDINDPSQQKTPTPTEVAEYTPAPTETITDPIENTPEITEMGNPSENPTEAPEVFVPTNTISFEEFEQLTYEEQEAYLYFWDNSISYNEAMGIGLELLTHTSDIRYGIGVESSIDKDGYTYMLIGMTTGRLARLFSEQRTAYVLCSSFSIDDFVSGQSYDLNEKSLWRRVDFDFTNIDELDPLPAQDVINRFGNISNITAYRCLKDVSKEPLEAYNKFINNFSNNFIYHYNEIISTFLEIDVLDLNNGNIIAYTKQLYRDPIICVSFDNGETWHTTTMTIDDYASILHGVASVVEVERYSYEDKYATPEPSFGPHNDEP